MSNEGYVLVINCGSSSLKYEVFRFPEKKSVGKGIVERIGDMASIMTHKALLSDKIYESKEAIKNHNDAFEAVAAIIVNDAFRLIESHKDIIAVGHRVVHGGDTYSKSIIIDDTVLNDIDAFSALAPLHNPAHVQGIKAAKKIFHHCEHIAVFDTAFHQTMPEHIYMYPLPYEVYEKSSIRRYGMHGTSHQYVAQKAAELLEKNITDTNLITCHLGNGSSITAIRKGQSIDTSMGFTPLAGLMMGTRCGDIDPAVITFLLKQGMSADEVDSLMNKKSGLLGISGISNDMRDVEAAEHTNHRAALALDMYAHAIVKFIGAYTAELGNVDMLVFTAGIGEFAYKMRQRVCKQLQGLGMLIDEEKNTNHKKHNGIISANTSAVKIAVIPTNEELQIATDAYTLTHQ